MFQIWLSPTVTPRNKAIWITPHLIDARHLHGLSSELVLFFYLRVRLHLTWIPLSYSGVFVDQQMIGDPSIAIKKRIIINPN